MMGVDAIPFRAKVLNVIFFITSTQVTGGERGVLSLIRNVRLETKDFYVRKSLRAFK